MKAVVYNRPHDVSAKPDDYRHFNARDKGWTKVILKPDQFT